MEYVNLRIPGNVLKYNHSFIYLYLARSELTKALCYKCVEK